jgi:hypothetical protein
MGLPRGISELEVCVHSWLAAALRQGAERAVRFQPGKCHSNSVLTEGQASGKGILKVAR